MSSALDFLRSRHSIYGRRHDLLSAFCMPPAFAKGRPLEKLLASEWLIRVFGLENYRKMWGPLLKCKLGALSGRDIGSLYLDIHLTLLFDAGKNSQSERKTGYVKRRLSHCVQPPARRNHEDGRQYCYGCARRYLIATSNEGIELTTARGRFHFDQVIATIPSRRFLLMAPQLTTGYARKLRKSSIWELCVLSFC